MHNKEVNERGEDSGEDMKPFFRHFSPSFRS